MRPVAWSSALSHPPEWSDHPWKNVNNISERHGHEPRLQLARDCSGYEGLPATWRSIQQEAATQAFAIKAAKFWIAHGRKERRLQPPLHLRHSGHVGKPELSLLDVEC